ncbi:MAG: hypothetical protein AB2693_27405, partial [Candidatus Thiodiazotropha sp.]
MAQILIPENIYPPRLCSKACGNDNAQKALNGAGAQAKRLYLALMHELWRMAHRQRILPFIGL